MNNAEIRKKPNP